MANAAARIAMAYAATPLVWQLVFNNQRSLNPSDRDPIGDLALLKAPDGTVPRGRAMMLSPTAQATPFQGLFLDPGPDRDDLSSALSRFVDQAARRAKLSPGARLLSERGLSLRAPMSRIEIVLRPGGPTELRVIGGAEFGVAVGDPPNGASDDEREPGGDGSLKPDQELTESDSAAEPENRDPADAYRPPVLTQAQITPLSIEVAARLVFALYRPGDRVSLDGLTERMRAHGLGVRRQRLVEVLTKLSRWGFLELSADGSRTLAGSWANTQELISRIAAAEEEGNPEPQVEASDWGADLDDEGGEKGTHDA
jgi:hypothetical protein